MVFRVETVLVKERQVEFPGEFFRDSLPRDPGLYGGAAPVAVDDADGDFQDLLQFAGEEIGDGAGFAIDMSPYAMVGSNPSFSSISSDCHTVLNGTTEAYLFSYPDGSCDLIWTDRYVFVLSWYSETADSAVLLRIAESMN